ncbi:Rho termination factor N-terminal domain-containing protein [Synechocystis sp. LEGE 06083]|uniref:Rho termination factor N-terminal domain-containing protein n=1 Tax=Synechocystis sp. LEGE 06083 TaxID=915336 RepID=UPI00187F6553|nr:Rho termination factor N-terminal domain-containing protein [Synechocystis sp. LEGE 06083]MBE9194215.1 Rho termination factor N-terminal domain-containing protein [Synechocystis sp. LEGE 06083]
MLQEIIVLTVAYIVLIGLLQPSKTTATDPVTEPVDYFPEVEEVAPETPAQHEPKAIAATALTTVEPMATAKPEPVQSFTVATPDLSKMGVRDLYKLASKAGIKGYKKLSKPQLIQALA